MGGFKKKNTTPSPFHSLELGLRAPACVRGVGRCLSLLESCLSPPTAQEGRKAPILGVQLVVSPQPLCATSLWSYTCFDVCI